MERMEPAVVAVAVAVTGQVDGEMGTGNRRDGVGVSKRETGIVVL